MVTSNHIHLLARDDGGRDVIPDSIKLTAAEPGRNITEGKIGKAHFGKIVTMLRQCKKTFI